MVGVDVEVPEDVECELEGVLEEGAAEGAGVVVDDELDGLSFLSVLSVAGFSPAAGAATSLPAGGLSLSE